MKDEVKQGYIIRGKMCRGIDRIEENPSPSNKTPDQRVLGNYEPYCNTFYLIDIECLEQGGVELHEICPHLLRLQGSGKIWKDLGRHKVVSEEYSARCNWPLNQVTGKVESSR